MSKMSALELNGKRTGLENLMDGKRTELINAKQRLDVAIAKEQHSQDTVQRALRIIKENEGKAYIANFKDLHLGKCCISYDAAIDLSIVMTNNRNTEEKNIDRLENELITLKNELRGLSCVV